MISFKANFINNTNIDRMNTDGSYSQQRVAFVELNSSDINSLREISNSWSHGDTFADDVVSDLIGYKSYLEAHGDKAKLDKKRFFALTRQQDDFATLNPRKVVALAEMKKDYDCPYDYLDILQVKPSLKKPDDTTPRKVKNIGKSIVQEILKIYKPKTILVEPLTGVINFYKKLGFQKCKGLLQGYFADKTMAYIRQIKP